MEKFLKNFKHIINIRNYKDGKEIRAMNYEHSLSFARRLIEQKHKNIEIIHLSPITRSFAVREKKPEYGEK